MRLLSPQRHSRPSRRLAQSPGGVSGCVIQPRLPQPTQKPSVPLCAMIDGSSAAATGTSRSEEHTSELQSLMRNSYAVFCLQKKTKTENLTTTTPTHTAL